MRVLQLWVVVPFGALACLAGCDRRLWYPPEHNDGTGGSPTTSSGDGGDLFPTSSSTGGVSPASCQYPCVPGKPALFEDLTMFWIGPPDKVPPCPAVAPLAGSVLYADLNAVPLECPTCSCGPAACSLPEEMHASAAKCADANGAAETSWDAPPEWEGVCSSEGAIAVGLACNGKPCVQSLTLAAPAVEACKPLAQGEAKPPEHTWGTVASECILWPVSGAGCGTGEACVPAAPEGFSLCVYRYGDDPSIPCPGAYPRRLVVYPEAEDERACEPCACGEATGAECTAFLSIFTDKTCTTQLASDTVDTLQGAACIDLVPGSALGSKDATLVTDKPGTCAPSGGVAKGTLQPANPTTLCCQPEPQPSK